MIPSDDRSANSPLAAAGTIAYGACCLVCLPIITLLAFAFGHGCYTWSVCAEYRRAHPHPGDLASVTFPSELERRRAETTLQCINFAGPQQQWEFLAPTAAAVLYGAIGWRWLGGRLVLLQVAGLLTLAAIDLGAANDALRARPAYLAAYFEDGLLLPDWAHAAKGGLVAGIVAAIGLYLLHRSVPSQPLTLRGVFLILVLVAVFLALVKASVQARYGAEIEEHRQDLRLMESGVNFHRNRRRWVVIPFELSFSGAPWELDLWRWAAQSESSGSSSSCHSTSAPAKAPKTADPRRITHQ